MIFDLNNFIDKYLNKNNKILYKKFFLEKVENLRQNNISEIRNKIRGHDFIQILCWYIEPYLSSTKKSFAHPDTLSGALLCCLDINILMKENLFKEIIIRLKIKKEKSNDGNH